MAESGPTKNDNPFSFKKFVNKKDTKPGESDEGSPDNDIDIFDLPDTVKPRKREKQKQIIVVTEEEIKAKPKKKGKSENPFSFKKFLSGSGPGNDVKPPIVNPSKSGESNTPKPKTEAISLTNPSDLPDFVQDHYSDTIPGVVAASNVSIPEDNTLPSINISPDIGDKNLVSRLGDSAVTQQRSHSGNDHDFSDEEEDQRTVYEQGSRISQLPDFLSDATIRSRGNSDSSKSAFDSGGEELGEDGEQKLRKLQDENSRLRRQVEQLTLQNAQSAESVSSLQRQLVQQKKKEEEETAVMERAMEQVERNLSDTTKRAVQAETVVTKLKQEVKTLQAEVKSLRAENRALGSGDQYVLDIKERTSYVADQLSTATKSAETSLRQMLSGVDNLKLLSQVLCSIDKITEEKTSPEGRQDLPGEGT